MKTPLEIIRTPCKGPNFSGSNGLNTPNLLLPVLHQSITTVADRQLSPAAGHRRVGKPSLRDRAALETAACAYLDDGVRCFLSIAILLLTILAGVPSRAATLASSGALSVP